MQSNRRSHAGGALEIGAVLAVLAASLAFVRSPPIPELAVAASCIFWRPRSGGWSGILMLGLAILPLLALLPASWLGDPAWRAAALGAGAPWTFTPQPWALLSVWASYLSGLVFLWWICGRSAGGGPRQAATLVFAVAVSAVLILGRWESGAWRGPHSALLLALFDTRNQAASFAAIALSGCAVRAAGAHQPKWRWAWSGAAAVCAASLLSLGSRGGLLAAVAGCLAGWGILASSQKRGWRTWLAAGSLVAVAGFVMLVLPSVPLLDRFASDGASGLGFRWAVQADAWRMLAAHPVSGVGLGSFDGVFPFFRSLSASIWRTVHPESDWLWFACEAGVLAALLAVAFGVLLAVRWWKCAVAGEAVSAAVGLGCLAALAVHGILDVPAHSGPVWFLAAALAGVGLKGSLAGPRPLVVPLLVALVLGWLAVAQSGRIPPVRPSGFSADRPIDLLPGREPVDRWMLFRPLDVGIVEVAAHQAIRAGDSEQAKRLLGRLFFLEPCSPMPAARAMDVLAARGDSDLAGFCAAAIIARTPPAGRGDRLRELLHQSSGNPRLADALLRIPPSTAAIQAARIEFLNVPVSRDEFVILFGLASQPQDPGLSGQPAVRALESALESGLPDLLETAAAIPAFRRAVHRVRAGRAASGGDAMAACSIVMNNLAPPIDRMEVVQPAGTDAYGLTMQALAESRAGKFAKARSLLRAAVSQRNVPPLAWYLLGCAEFRDAAYERAWDAFARFLSAGDGAESSSH